MYKIHRIFPYDWKIDSKEVNVTSLRIYGLDEQNKTICVRVDNFTPYAYLELPKGIDWDENSALKLCSKIDSLLGDKKPLFKSFEMKKRLYYAHIDSKGKRKKFPYLFLAFSTRSDIKTLSYKIRSPINIPGLGRIRLKMHEQDANEILQLTCRKNIPTAGWIKFKGAEIRDEDEKLTTCDKEFIVDWKNLSAEETDRVPPKPLILSFDLEVYSSDPNTMPKSERLGDKIFQISCVFCRQGDKDDKDFDKVLLTLGNPLKSIVGNDVDIRTFITEDDLIMGFTELIQEKQPNLVVGYNIFGFDIPYMIARATSPCMCFREFSRMGFIKNREAEMKIIKWSSSAYGNQEFEFLDAEGRLFVDLLPLVKRDYKMDTYSLKSISTFFIGETKDPLSAKGIFKCYDLGTTKKDDGSYGKKAKKAMAICGKYCVQDSALVLKLFDKLQTWIGLTEMARVCHVPIFTLYTQGQQIKVYSQVYKRCMYQGYVVEKDGYIVKENEHYTGAHVFEPIAGSYEDVIPFDFTSLYPTTIIAYNICWSTLVTDESFPDSLCHVFEWSDHCGCIIEGSNITIDEYSMKIEDLKDFNQNLLAFDKDNKGASYYKQTNFFNQGVKDCVKLTFEDGTTLSCTPDHRILLSDYTWVEAQDIKINDDRVCTTYSPPVFDVDGIKLNIFNYTFSGSKLIKFYKILGILCSDGHCNKSSTIVFIGHKIDLKNIVRDIESLEKNSTSVYKENYGWGVRIKGKLGELFRNLDGMMWNAKIDQVRTLPKILEKASTGELCAFLSGLFGGDGHTLSYSEKSQCLGTICLSWTSKKEEQLTEAFTQLEKYLKVCDISSSVGRNKDYTYINIKTQDIFKFKEKINFSYCVHKSMRLEAGYSYLKLRDEVWTQQKWLVEKVKLYKNTMTIKDATEKACKELKDNFPIYNEYYSSPTKSQMVDLLRPRKKWQKPMFSYKYFPTAPEYLDSINAKSLFESYGVDKDEEVIPFLNKKVIKISPIGKKQVYDLEVDQSHSFVADGVLVHNCEHDTTVRKTRPKHKMCAERRYRFLKSPKGILPEMLTDLLDARKKTKIEMKDKKKLLKTISDSEKTNLETAITVLDKRQLAFKVSANSAYGAMGVQRGYLPFMPGAMCTTARGRQSIEKVAEYIPKEHGGQLIYGDTDTLLPDSPLIIKNKNGYIEYRTMEELSNGEWEQTVTGKEISKAQEGLLVWSDIGFTPIKYVIRHSITKPLIRVTTHVGSVECTLDHSLLWENGEAAKASNVKIGSKLCISEMPLPEDTPKEPLYPNKLTTQKIEEYIIPETGIFYGNDEYINCEVAFVLGLFYADGSCGKYLTPSGVRATWAINNQDSKLLNKCLNILNEHENNFNFIIMNTMKSSGVNKLVPRLKNKNDTIVSLVKKYREMFYDQRRSKRIPNIIFNSPFDIRQSFFMGYYAGDGSKKDPAISCSNKGAIGSAGLFYLMKTIGYKVSINVRKDKPNIYKLTGSSPAQKFRYCPNKVKKIEETSIRNSIVPLEKPSNFIQQAEYIYDIETDNHHFAAGVGQMVVHNSNYIHFPHMIGKSAQELWEYSEMVAADTSKLFPAPMRLEFEEVIYRKFFIITKKRYMCLSCDKEGNVSDKISKKGVILARRDNAKIVRDIYGDNMMKVFHKVPEDEILYDLINTFNKMFYKGFPYTDFIITKSVRGYNELKLEDVKVEECLNMKGEHKKDKNGELMYRKTGMIGDYKIELWKNKEEKERKFKVKNVENEKDYYLRCLPAQVQLAEKMRCRGKPVSDGTRLEYVMLTDGTSKSVKDKKYEKIESAEYYNEYSHILKIDFLCYLDNIASSLDQVLNVVHKNKDFVLNQYKIRLQKLKVLEELKSIFEVKVFFDDEIKKDKGQKDIRSYFKKK